MAICCKCGKKKAAEYEYATGEALCEACASNLYQCPQCGKFFEHWQMEGNFCGACSMEVED